MSDFQKKIKIEIDDLVELGDELMNTASQSGNYLSGTSLAKFSMWVTRLGFTIRKLYGVNSQHYENYQQILSERDFYKIHGNNWSQVSVMAGIIQSVQHEFDNGLINDLQKLVQADVFGDFLSMAEYLFEEGYKDSSAIIIGSVLEDTLRKLAQTNSISIYKDNGKSLTIEPLNVALAKQNVYDKLIQKQVTSWADLRNKAAHGHFEEYSKEQVYMMLLFVQQFCSDYLK